jgi:hypothetical protein
MVLTGALTGAAIVVAGNDIATPVRPFSLTTDRPQQPDQDASESHEVAHDPRPGGIGEVGQPGDDHVGDDASGSNSGPGSGSSGSGSQESGDPAGDQNEDDGNDDD